MATFKRGRFVIDRNGKLVKRNLLGEAIRRFIDKFINQDGSIKTIDIEESVNKTQ